MAGTKDGGIKAAETNKQIHGEDFYKRIGAIGGRNGHTGGFAANRELAREAGRKGGFISKRGPSKKKKVKVAEKKELPVEVKVARKRRFGWLFGKGENEV
jgi:general stress protein YciG